MQCVTNAVQCVTTYSGNVSLSIFIHCRVGLRCSVDLTISLYSALDSLIFGFLL